MAMMILLAPWFPGGCQTAEPPRDAGSEDDATGDASSGGPKDAGVDAAPIDWPDASWEQWPCEGGYPGPCPPEKPFCCADQNKGPDVCETGGDWQCVEWPNDAAVAVDGCRDPGVQCPAGYGFCCFEPGEVCAIRELEGWLDCAPDE